MPIHSKQHLVEVEVVFFRLKSNDIIAHQVYFFIFQKWSKFEVSEIIFVLFRGVMIFSAQRDI